MVHSERKTLFQNKGYIYLIVAQTLSSLGSWLDMLALMGLVAIKWNASPLEMSGVMLMLILPMVFLAPIAGVLADRYERKHIMMISNVICIVLVLGIAFSTALWQVYLLLFIRGFFEALFGPAKSGKVKEIVGVENIQAAMGLSGMIENASKIIGPFISGLLVAVIGIQGSFITNAIVIAVSTIFLLGIPKADRLIRVDQYEKKDWFGKFKTDIKEGLLFLRTIPIVLISIVLLAILMMALQLADTQIIILFRGIFVDPTQIMGYGIAAAGLGMFIASAIFTRKEIKSTLSVIIVATIAMGTILITTVLIKGFSTEVLTVIYPIVFLLMGFSVGAAVIPTNIIAQKQTPVDKTGRVFGLMNSLTTLGMLIGILGGGLLSEIFGVVVAFVLSGSLLIVLGITTFPIKLMVERRQIHVTESLSGVQREA